MVVVDEESKKRKRLYWRVCREEYKEEKSGTIRYTYPVECKAITESKEASNFYLKPCSLGKDCERYFYIVTDPEDDVKSNAEVEPKHQASAAKAEPEHGGVQNSCNSEPVHEPQRYIQINPETNQLEAVLVVRTHKGHSAFKLKNPQNDKTYSLSRSQWLPEASLGSQPYIICRDGKPLQSWSSTKSVCFERKECRSGRKGQGIKTKGKETIKSQSSNNCGIEGTIDVEYGQSHNDGQDDKEGKDSEYIITYKACSLSKIPFSDRLFILERGHKT